MIHSYRFGQVPFFRIFFDSFTVSPLLLIGVTTALCCLGCGQESNAPMTTEIRNDEPLPATLEFKDQSPKHVLLGGRSDLEGVKMLKFTGQVDDTGWDGIPAIMTLKVLKLDHTRIGNRTLQMLDRFPNLEELTLTGTLITDDGIAALAALPKLKKIRLSKTSISNAAVTELSKLKTLEEIDLSETAVSDSCITTLAELPALTKLNLYMTSISDEARAALSALTTLTWLNLDATRITDDTLVRLPALKKLEWLHLGRTSVSDAGLVSLASMTSLRTLHVTRTSVTREGVVKLQEALPECKIIDDVREAADLPKAPEKEDAATDNNPEEKQDAE